MAYKKPQFIKRRCHIEVVAPDTACFTTPFFQKIIKFNKQDLSHGTVVDLVTLKKSVAVQKGTNFYALVTEVENDFGKKVIYVSPNVTDRIDDDLQDVMFGQPPITITISVSY